jgi:hypothetical protein
VKLLHINGHAPLAAWQAHPGAQLRLFCGACGWARTYDPERVARRLAERRAGHIRKPCPGCERSRWRTVLVGPESQGVLKDGPIADRDRPLLR